MSNRTDRLGPTLSRRVVQSPAAAHEEKLAVVDPPPNGTATDVIVTYRVLRLAMVTLMLTMLLAPGYQWWWETDHSCWLGSISAYYYTPARVIFVGALFALGTSLIAYKGHSQKEDILLNFCGIVAMIVAIVPTSPDLKCGVNAYDQTQAQSAAAVRNSIWTLLIATVIIAIIAVWLTSRGSERPTKLTPSTKWIGAACLIVLIIELVLFLTKRDTFINRSHAIASITLVVGIVSVMIAGAVTAAKRHRDEPASKYRGVYLALAISVVVFLAVAFLVIQRDYFVLAAEIVVLVLFSTYWVVQTHELWDLDTDLARPSSLERREVSAVTG